MIGTYGCQLSWKRMHAAAAYIPLQLCPASKQCRRLGYCLQALNQTRVLQTVDRDSPHLTAAQHMHEH
jgi:hypothetical protein